EVFSLDGCDGTTRVGETATPALFRHRTPDRLSGAVRLISLYRHVRDPASPRNDPPYHRAPFGSSGHLGARAHFDHGSLARLTHSGRPMDPPLSPRPGAA